MNELDQLNERLKGESEGNENLKRGFFAIFLIQTIDNKHVE